MSPRLRTMDWVLATIAVRFADQYSKRESESGCFFSKTTETNGEIPVASRCEREKKIWRTCAKLTTCSNRAASSQTRRKLRLLRWCLKNNPEEASSPALP